MIDKARIITTLEKARELVAEGWHEPFSLDADGKICTPEAEGIARFSVDDAVTVAAGNDPALASATREALEARFRWPGGLLRWLEAEGRQLAEVLRFLERATNHLRAET